MKGRLTVRTAMLMLAVLLLLSVNRSWSGVVIHDGRPGIVSSAINDNAVRVLDNLGHVWLPTSGGYVRSSEWDPPMPVSQIRFWEREILITEDNALWMRFWPDGWTRVADWPGIADTDEASHAMAATAVSPNPTPGPCRVSFSLVVDGPVSVDIIDVSGRIVRRLVDGPHPAGDYSLKWDGKDDAGRELPAGVYFTHVMTAEGTTTRRVVLAR
jgi:hypothetical protein